MTDSVYSPPVAEPMPAAPIDRKRGRGIAVTGLVLMAASFAGVLMTAWAMIQAFGTLAESGQADPEVLAGDVSTSLVATMIGSVFGMVGGVLCGIALFGPGNRERWFFRNGIVLAVLNLLVFPIGTVVAIALLVGFIIRRSEFRIGPNENGNPTAGDFRNPSIVN